MVSANPIASDNTLASASSGHELAVFGSVLAGWPGAPVWLCPADVDASDDGAADEVDAAAFGAAGSVVAFTSCWVMTFGGLDVIIVAVSRSPSRKSESCAGLPPFIIFT